MWSCDDSNWGRACGKVHVVSHTTTYCIACHGTSLVPKSGVVLNVPLSDSDRTNARTLQTYSAPPRIWEGASANSLWLSHKARQYLWCWGNILRSKKPPLPRLRQTRLRGVIGGFCVKRIIAAGGGEFFEHVFAYIIAWIQNKLFIWNQNDEHSKLKRKNDVKT